MTDYLRLDAFRSTPTTSVSQGDLFAQAITIPANLIREESTEPTGRAPLFRAVLPENVTPRVFFSANENPINTLVVNPDGNIGGPPPGVPARALLRVNPDATILATTMATFKDENDPAYQAARKEVAGKLQIPETNLVLVNAELPNWPRDQFLTGSLGMIEPQAPLQVGGGSNMRTERGTNQLGGELDLPVFNAPTVARFGDTQFITRPDGQQTALGSEETLAYAAKALGIPLPTRVISGETIEVVGLSNNVDRLRAIALTMENLKAAGVDNLVTVGHPKPVMAEAATVGAMVDLSANLELRARVSTKLNDYWSEKGIDPGFLTKGRQLDRLSPEEQSRILGPEDVASLTAERDRARASGEKSTTYGDVIAQMQPGYWEKISPAVRKELLAMSELPFPESPYDYHTDLVARSPDGKHLVVSDKNSGDPALRAIAEHQGFEILSLPGGRLQDHVPEAQGRLELNYMNMVHGRTQDGRVLILLPTYATDPKDPHPVDLEAERRLRAAMPDAVIEFQGGRTALVGNGLINGQSFESSYGTNCLTNQMPHHIVSQRPGLLPHRAPEPARSATPSGVGPNADLADVLEFVGATP